MIVTGISKKSYCEAHREGMIPQKMHFWFDRFDKRNSENLTENQHSPILTKMTSIDRI
jgi:hypothetical protein